MTPEIVPQRLQRYHIYFVYQDGERVRSAGTLGADIVLGLARQQVEKGKTLIVEPVPTKEVAT